MAVLKPELDKANIKTKSKGKAVIGTVEGDIHDIGLRSGEADSLDQMVAITFANVAMDLIEGGLTARMTAIRDGKYDHVPLPDPAIGARRVDVARAYNEQRFRPRYDGRLGDPLLLAMAV